MVLFFINFPGHFMILILILTLILVIIIICNLELIWDLTLHMAFIVIVNIAVLIELIDIRKIFSRILIIIYLLLFIKIRNSIYWHYHSWDFKFFRNLHFNKSFFSLKHISFWRNNKWFNLLLNYCIIIKISIFTDIRVSSQEILCPIWVFIYYFFFYRRFQFFLILLR